MNIILQHAVIRHHHNIVTHYPVAAMRGYAQVVGMTMIPQEDYRVINVVLVTHGRAVGHTVEVI
jgi:hypothetical protein